MTDKAVELKVAALSLDINYAFREENIARAAEMIDRLPMDVDIVVLPELFSTGFISDSSKLAHFAEPDNGPTMDAMCSISRERGCLICGSFAATDGALFYNRGFMALPDSDPVYYNKRHLFGVSAEADVYTRGTQPMPVVEFMGWNISMIVCYDLRFPVWSRNLNHRYDMLLVPANWPQSRGYAWKHLLIARAIENQAVVVGANRGGKDEYGEYDGMSEIFDGLGMPIGRQEDGGQIVMAAVSPADLVAARRRLPAHLDADDFDIPL